MTLIQFGVLWSVVATIWAVILGRWLRRIRRRTHRPLWEQNVRDRQVQREVDESAPIVWRR